MAQYRMQPAHVECRSQIAHLQFAMNEIKDMLKAERSNEEILFYIEQVQAGQTRQQRPGPTEVK